MVGQSDTTLVAAARTGNRRAVDELLAQHLPLVYNIAGRALGERADVDDVVQEALARIVNDLPGLAEPHYFRPWLISVVGDCLREHHRSRHVTPTPLDDAVQLAEPGSDFVELTLIRLGLTHQRREVALGSRWIDPADRDLLSLWWLASSGHLAQGELVEAMRQDPQHVSDRVTRMREQLDDGRLVVRVLSAKPRCPQLADTATHWRGEENPLWRKRFVRHVRECAACSRNSELIPAERLLSGLSLVPVPAGYIGYMLAAAHRPSAPVAAESRIPGRPTSHRQQQRRGGRLPAKPLAGIAAVIALAGGGAGALYMNASPGSHPTTNTALGSNSSTSPGGGSPSSSASEASSKLSQPSTPSHAAAKPSHPAMPATTPASLMPKPSSSSAPPKTSTTTPPASNSNTSTASSPANQVLALINQARAAAGLPAYTMTSGLIASATAHNQTMVSQNCFAHQCSGEPALGDRETAAGVHWSAAGENIGEGGPVSNTNAAIAQMAVGLTQGMLNEKPPDDGHRQNILSSTFRHIGIAVYRNSSGTVWLTQDFSD